MIDKEELLFVVDESNNSLETQPREIVHQKNLWHRTTGVWVVNSKGQVLCQRRSLTKDIKPGFWEAFFGGHLGTGEDYLESAVNEVNEELGLNIGPKDLIPYKVFKSDKPDHKEFQQVIRLNLDVDIESLDFESDEIEELKWLDIGKLKIILVEHKDPSWVIKPWDKEILNWLEHD